MVTTLTLGRADTASTREDQAYGRVKRVGEIPVSEASVSASKWALEINNGGARNGGATRLTSMEG